MARHEVKIWSELFDAVVSGKKRAELRKNDRDYQDGDVLEMREFDPHVEQYTGRSVTVLVTHVQRIAELDATLKNVMGLNPCLAPVNLLAVLSIDVVASVT
jgi:Domain of unknown function (DUF3850)